MKIRSGVPENGCLIVVADGKQKKKQKQNKNKKNAKKSVKHILIRAT